MGTVCVVSLLNVTIRDGVPLIKGPQLLLQSTRVAGVCPWGCSHFSRLGRNLRWYPGKSITSKAHPLSGDTGSVS